MPTKTIEWIGESASLLNIGDFDVRLYNTYQNIMNDQLNQIEKKVNSIETKVNSILCTMYFIVGSLILFIFTPKFATPLLSIAIIITFIIIILRIYLKNSENHRKIRATSSFLTDLKSID